MLDSETTFTARTRYLIRRVFGGLEPADVQTQGSCAPEYYWHNHVADIVEEPGYSFSNSLGFDFSNYPYRPVVNGQIRRYFEMPVDPLVLNHFSRAIGSDIEANLVPYYQSLLEAKCTQNGQPCLLYCHPAGEGVMPAIMDTILTFVDSQEDVLPVTQSAPGAIGSSSERWVSPACWKRTTAVTGASPCDSTVGFPKQMLSPSRLQMGTCG